MIIKIFLIFITLLLVFSNCLYAETLPVASRFRNKDNIFEPIKIIASERNIYLLDKEDQAVKIFTKEGKFLKAIGRKGQGPGEFRNATDFLIAGDKIYILDSYKIEVFEEKDGSHILSKRLKTMNSMKFCMNKETYYIFSLAYQRGDKLIKKYLDKGEFKLVNSFLDCFPMENGNIASMYKNFGFIAYLKGKVYFAYMLSNLILEFSEDGKLVNRLKAPLRTIDIEKQEIKKTERQWLLNISSPAIQDIRVDNDNLYLLSSDEKGNSLIFKLENNVFTEKYRMKEKIVSFDISGKELWAIGSLNNVDVDILVYKLSR